MYYQDEHYCFSTYEWALLYIFFRWKERNWHPTCTYVLNMQFIHSLMSTTNNRALTYVNCSNGTEVGLRLYLCHSFCSQIEWATEFYMPSLCVCGERERMSLLLATSCFQIPCHFRCIVFPSQTNLLLVWKASGLYGKQYIHLMQTTESVRPAYKSNKYWLLWDGRDNETTSQ